MKKIILLLVLLSLWAIGFSQDVIVLKTGEEISAKVLKISQSVIEYKKWDSQAGPTYEVAKSIVFMIKYQNGEKELFSATEQKTSAPTASSMPSPTYSSPTYAGRMSCANGDVYLNGRELSRSEAVSLLGGGYNAVRGMDIAGSVCSSFGWGTLITGALIWWFVDMEAGLIIAGNSLDFFIPSWILKGVSKSKLNNLVDGYNARNTLALSPTISKLNLASNDTQLGFGLALTYKF